MQAGGREVVGLLTLASICVFLSHSVGTYSFLPSLFPHSSFLILRESFLISFFFFSLFSFSAPYVSSFLFFFLFLFFLYFFPLPLSYLSFRLTSHCLFLFLLVSLLSLCFLRFPTSFPSLLPSLVLISLLFSCAASYDSLSFLNFFFVMRVRCISSLWRMWMAVVHLFMSVYAVMQQFFGGTKIELSLSVSSQFSVTT